MVREVYMDHAATSFPKPEAVHEAVDRWNRELGASGGRGDYPRAVGTSSMIARCRERIAELLNAPDPSRVIFTLNCTDALNLAIRGLELKSGDAVICGPTEHNSIMRPLNALSRDQGIRVIRLSSSPDGTCDPKELQSKIDSSVKLVTIQHASNVLGAIHDIEAIGNICHRHSVPFLVDAAQTVGSIPIDLATMPVDFLAAPGHKALQGPLGTGFLVLSDRFDLTPWRVGGTGSISEEEWHPERYPDRLEAGSHNAPGIVGLLAGVDWVLARGVDRIRSEEVDHMTVMIEEISELEKDGRVRLTGPADARKRSPVINIGVADFDPHELAERLWKDAGVMVRPGLHCAPEAHRVGGTFPDGGVRFSFGPMTTKDEIHQACEALRRILTGRPSSAGRLTAATQ